MKHLSPFALKWCLGVGLLISVLLSGALGLLLFAYFQYESRGKGSPDDAQIVTQEIRGVNNYFWHFSGELNAATAQKLEALVEEHDMFRFLFLTSVGGTLEGANRVIDIIKANNIEVAIRPHSICYSACVKVLLETTHRGSSFLGSKPFLIGIHRAHDGDSLLSRYVLPYYGERTYDTRMMREWIVAHSAEVADFLDQCPSSPYDDLEMFVLTSHQYQEISRGLDDYTCADIWHQHEDWADQLWENWRATEAHQNS